MTHWVVLLMVFGSVSGICFILCRTLFADLDHSGTEHSGGWDGRSQLEYFISKPKLRKMQIGLAVVGALIMLCLLLVAGVSVWAIPAIVLMAGAAAYFLPLLYYRQKVKKRNAEFKSRLLDVVLGLNNGMRSGVALPQALEVVGRDIGTAYYRTDYGYFQGTGDRGRLAQPAGGCRILFRDGLSGCDFYPYSGRRPGK